MNNGVFVSYRRQHASMAAGRLVASLKDELEGAQVFRDVETIEPGADFVETLEKALNGCAALLAIINPGWAEIRSESGQRRLDDPDDWIRLEIVTALKRNVRVVPVLVEGANMPAAGELPPELQPLLRRQAIELDDGRWATDVARLADTLAKIPPLRRRRHDAGGTSAPVRPQGVGKALKIGAGIGAAIGVLGLIGSLMDHGGGNGPTPTPQPYVQPVQEEPTPPKTGGQAPPVRDSGNNGAGTRQGIAIDGLWNSASGESYTFQVQGGAVAVAAHYGGNQIGQGQGQFNGSRLVVSLWILLQGTPVLTNCQLDLAMDGRSMTGGCYTPATGMTTGARIYR